MGVRHQIARPFPSPGVIRGVPPGRAGKVPRPFQEFQIHRRTVQLELAEQAVERILAGAKIGNVYDFIEEKKKETGKFEL